MYSIILNKSLQDKLFDKGKIPEPTVPEPAVPEPGAPEPETKKKKKIYIRTYFVLFF